MPSMLGSGYPVEGGTQAEEDGIGDIIPRQEESQGEVFGVWGGNGYGVAGSP